MEISEELAAALHLLVRTADVAETAPSDRQAARRAIEQASVVARIAKNEGFGEGS
jgi:hypothetical protein